MHGSTMALIVFYILEARCPHVDLNKAYWYVIKRGRVSYYTTVYVTILYIDGDLIFTVHNLH